jgi:acylphosphatase|tara:strand:- start:93 stop:383 length:291 start_codon:yes stop_codon:yes gene_type:complete
MTLKSETVSFEATIRGVVQGVNFRLYTNRQAARLKVTGWVRNQPDGSVQVLAQGRTSTLHELIALLWEGPGIASVTDVDINWMPAGEIRSDFRVLW